MPLSLISSGSVLALGLALGFKHAFDADHIAAVSTIVSERGGILRASAIGAAWGLGHSIALLVAGGAVVLAGVRIGEDVARVLEVAVAVMLIGLGVNTLHTLLRGGTIHLHMHQHGVRIHFHPHVHNGSPEPEPATHHGMRLAARPLVIGLLHGLAGSAALMLLVLPTITSRALALAYIGLFGLGSILGMLMVSTFISLPLHLTATRFARTNFAIRTAAGVFSLGCGALMLHDLGIVGRLLL